MSAVRQRKVDDGVRPVPGRVVSASDAPLQLVEELERLELGLVISCLGKKQLMGFLGTLLGDDCSTFRARRLLFGAPSANLSLEREE